MQGINAYKKYTIEGVAKAFINIDNMKNHFVGLIGMADKSDKDVKLSGMDGTALADAVEAQSNFYKLISSDKSFVNRVPKLPKMNLFTQTE